MLGYCQHDTPSKNSRISRNSKIRVVSEERRDGKHKPPEIRQLTGIPERTQRNWVTAAKASGDWDGISLKAAPRKRRSDSGVGRKLTRRMIAAIKTRLLEVEGGHTKY